MNEDIRARIKQSLPKRPKILMLERDSDTYNSVGAFRKILIDEKIEHNCLFRVHKLPVDYIVEQLEWFDIIVFETTWVSEVSQRLKKLLFNHKFEFHKTIIECCGYMPSWHAVPLGLPNDHKFYAFIGHQTDHESDMEYYQLKSNEDV